MAALGVIFQRSGPSWLVKGLVDLWGDLAPGSPGGLLTLCLRPLVAVWPTLPEVSAPIQRCSLGLTWVPGARDGPVGLSPLWPSGPIHGGRDGPLGLLARQWPSGLSSVYEGRDGPVVPVGGPLATFTNTGAVMGPWVALCPGPWATWRKKGAVMGPWAVMLC